MAAGADAAAALVAAAAVDDAPAVDSAGTAAVDAAACVSVVVAWAWEPEVSPAATADVVMVVTAAGGALPCCSDWAVSCWSL